MSKVSKAKLEAAVLAAVKANTVRPIRDVNDPVLRDVRAALTDALPETASARDRKALRAEIKTRLEIVGLGFALPRQYVTSDVCSLSKGRNEMKLKNPADMIRLLVGANEAGLHLADDIIRKLITDDREAFDSLLSVAAETPEARSAILRAIVIHASAPPSPPAVTGKRPIEEPSEMDRIFDYLKKQRDDIYLTKSAILDGAKIKPEDRTAAWQAAISSGKIESNGKRGRGTAYRYKA